MRESKTNFCVFFIERRRAKGFQRLLTIIALFALLFTSCGYRMSQVGGVVPETARTIAIPVFLNATYEPSVDTVFTQSVVDEFLTDGRLKVVSLEDADLVLRCKIMKFELTPAAYTANSYVQTYNVSITISFTLEDTKTRKILLTDNNLNSSFLSSYPVTLGGIAATKVVKEAAIAKTGKDIASTIRSRVLEGF